MGVLVSKRLYRMFFLKCSPVLFYHVLSSVLSVLNCFDMFLLLITEGSRSQAISVKAGGAWWSMVEQSACGHMRHANHATHRPSLRTLSWNVEHFLMSSQLWSANAEYEALHLLRHPILDRLTWSDINNFWASECVLTTKSH